MALDTTIKTQLQTYLQMLREPIVLAASLDDSAGAKEMSALLEEISAMSDMITLTHEDDAANAIEGHCDGVKPKGDGHDQHGGQHGLFHA